MIISAADLSYSLTRDRAEVEAAWIQLLAKNHHSLHQSPNWNDAWTKTYSTELFFLVGRYGDDIKLLLPVELTRKFAIKALAVPGASFSNLTSILTDADITPPANDSEIASLRISIEQATRPFADALIITGLALEWRGQRSAFFGLESVTKQNKSFQLPLLDTFEQTLKQINAKRRRKKYRISRETAAELGGYAYKIASTNDEKRRIFDVFLRQKSKRLEEFHLPNPFANDKTRRSLYSLLDSGSGCGGNQMLELHYLEMEGASEGVIAAVSAISRKGDHSICQFSSIESGPTAEMSPGELLFYHVIEHENNNGVKLFDFGIGDQPYKRSWCPIETEMHDVYIGATVKGRMLCQAMVAETSAKRFIKARPKLYSLAQRIRKLLPR